MIIDPWYLENLVCPVDYDRLGTQGRALICPAGHLYPIVEGMPVMLLDNVPLTADFVRGSSPRTNNVLDSAQVSDDWYLDSLGISDSEKIGAIELAQLQGPIDPVVAYLVAATNGLMYRHLTGRLDRYPIPDIPLPAGAGRLLLDVGCSWGRWCLAANAKGYKCVGIDPSLGAVKAAQRVAKQLGIHNHYVVGDARYLPFAAEKFDQVYSYSVIQHFSHDNASKAISELGRVLKANGNAMIQMPTRLGLRCLYHQLRRRLRRPEGFEVRYRSIHELRQLLMKIGSEPRILVDCYFGIGLQKSDAELMPPHLKVVLNASEALKAVSRKIPFLTHLADSVFVQCLKQHRNC